mgnify:FL=1
MMSELLKELKVINMGLTDFFDDLKEQNVKAIHVDWKPPSLDEDMDEKLDKIL